MNEGGTNGWIYIGSSIMSYPLLDERHQIAFELEKYRSNGPDAPDRNILRNVPANPPTAFYGVHGVLGKVYTKRVLSKR